MTIFATDIVQVQRFAIGLYNTVVGTTTMGQVKSQIDGSNLNATLNSYYSSGFGSMTTTQVASILVANFGITGAANIATATAYVVAVLNAAPANARGQAILNITTAFSGLAADPVFGGAATAFNSKVALADVYQGASNVSPAPSAPSPIQYLTAGIDNLTGTAAADTFISGEAGNGLNTSDTINGGAGFDTVNAVMTSQNFAVRPNLSNVEKVIVTAQNDNPFDGGDVNQAGQDAVQIDLDNSVGVINIESNNSRADLIVEDVRLADDKITKDATIEWRDADPGKVDFAVYFDQLSLRNISASTSLINLRVLDTYSTQQGLAPLKDSPYGSFTFSYSVNGSPLTVATLASNAIRDAQTFAELRAALQAASDAVFGVNVVAVTLGSTYTVPDPVTGVNVQGTEIVLSASGNITFDTTPPGSGWLATETVPAISGLYTSFNTNVATTTALVTSTIILDNVGRGSNAGDLLVGGQSVGDTSPSQGVQRFDITVMDDSKVSSITSTNNTLREVYIVNAETDRDRNAYNTFTNAAGNLTVDERGAQTAPGNLPGQNTTAGPNQGQDGFGFTDVRLIDASAMTGRLDADIGVTVASFGKYLNRTDVANDPAADNVQFVYSGGTNNDTLSLSIASAVAASSGRLSSQEDAKFTVNGNGGNDRITVTLRDAVTNNLEHTAQKTFDNITINGGEGNDTIRTPGIADMVINAGTGNDTVYTDNSALNRALTPGTPAVPAGPGPDGILGNADDTPAIPATPAVDTGNDDAGDRNVWTVSTSGGTLANLDGQAHGAFTTQFLFKGQVRVTYASEIAAGGVTNGAAAALTNGWESALVAIPTGANSAVTQFHLNQAIKKAINEDPVLGKLLLAEDGPNNALRISSLVDGANVTTGINIEVSVPTLTTAEATQSLTDYRNFLADSTQLAGADTAASALTVTQLNSRAGMVGTATFGEIVGTNSLNDRDNFVDLGAGTDVLVLSSSLLSNETVRFSSDDIGRNSIVNFSTGVFDNVIGGDQLDFNAVLLGKVTGAPAGNTIQRDVDISLNADAVTEVNSVRILNGVTFNATQTFDGLLAANLLAAVNSTAVTYGALGTGAFVLDAAVGAAALAGTNSTTSPLNGVPVVQPTGGATLVGTSYDSIFMVENAGNLGEYKVFKMTAALAGATVAGDFTSAVLLGVVDFGNTLGATFTGVDNLAI